MNTRLLPVAKSILCSAISHITKNKGIAFVICFSLCSAIILLFTGKFNVEARHPETKEILSENEISGLNSNALANLSLVVRVVQDGLAPMNLPGDTLNGREICPMNSAPTPGCDFSPNNGIVRTNDQVVYTFDYSVNASGEDITVIAFAPPGMVWDYLPAFCYAANDPNPGDPGSTMTGDGTVGNQSIITCRRRMKASGTAESLPFYATVLGTELNGNLLNAGGIVTGPNSQPGAFASAPNVTVSAAPRFNLRKTFFTYSGNDNDGYFITYLATIGVFRVFNNTPAAEPNPRYGSSVLSNPITFTDVVSSISPKAQYISCSVHNTYGINDNPPMAINCMQPGGAGQPITASVTNANTSLRQYQIPPTDGIFGIGAFRLTVFIPASEITAGGHTITDLLDDFDPLSPPSDTNPNGLPNFSTNGENMADNSVTVPLMNPPPPTPGSGFFRKTFVRDYNNSGNLGIDTFVAPGEIFASQVFFSNNTNNPLSEVVLCDVMDNTKYSVIETFPNSMTVHEYGGAQVPTVQFATGYVNPNWLPTAPGNLNEIRAECSDSVNWRPITDFLPGNSNNLTLASITKFRALYSNPIAVGDSPSVRVRVQARDTDFISGHTIFSGTPLVNLGVWRSGNGGMFINNDYARLILARATVRITKETENNDTANSIETANSNGIGFVLKPTISPLSATAPLTPAHVTVTDILPVGLLFNGIANPQPTQTFYCEQPPYPSPDCAANGQYVLFWDLGTLIPNTPIAPITFRATADLTVLNNEVLTNTAFISSPADPSHISLRTATRSVFGASPSTFLIYKQTNTPQINAGGNFSYTVTYRNASFLTDFSGMDFIDILPFDYGGGNDDRTLDFGSGTHQRTPHSSYSGSRTFTGAVAVGGAPVWYYTRAPALSINLSPKHSSNLNPGTAASIWCAGTTAGPISGAAPHCDNFLLSQITAVRMQDTMLMPRNDTIRSFKLNFSSSGNQPNNVYTNNSGGSVAEITLPVSSVNVPVVVLNGSITGTVWFDTTSDGARLPAETGRVSGLTVTLSGTNSGGSVNQTTTTDANGNYAFNGLPSGNYTVQFSRPTDYTASPQNQGLDDTIDSDGDVSTLTTQAITLGVNDNRVNVDQGFYQLNLGGTVWRDTMPTNGLLDPGELRISGLSVELLDINGTVIAPAQTTENTTGNYLFIGLAAGSYRVRVNTNGNGSPIFNQTPDDNIDNDNNGIQQSGSVTSNPITLFPGNEPIVNQTEGKTLNETLDFGLLLAPTAAGVTLGGRVVTADGRGISKASVSMTDASGTIHHAVTNPFGFYRFTDVPAGTTVIISVNSKSYTFAPSTQVISVLEDLHEINFVAAN